MTTNEIRFRNCEHLLARFQADYGVPTPGLITRFAEVVGLSVTDLHQIKAERRNISAAVTRRVEVSMGLPEGWMDMEHGEGELPSTPEQEFMQGMRLFYREDPVAAQAMLVRLLLTKISNTRQAGSSARVGT